MEKVLSILNPNRVLRNFKIRNKITTTFSIMILLFVSSISYFSYYYSTKLITEKSVGYTLGILEQISNNIDNNLKQIDMTSLIINNNTKILNVLKYGRSTLLEGGAFDNFMVDTVLFDVMYSRRDIDSIYLFDKNGNQWNTMSMRMNADFDDLYRQAEAGEGKFVFLDVKKDSRVIPVIRLVRNMGLEPVGLLMVNIKEDSIYSVFSGAMEKLKGKVYVTNETGLIFSSTDSELIGTRLKKGITNKLDRPGHVMDTINGEKCIVAYYPSQYNNFKYIGVIPLKAITVETAYIGKVSIIACCVAVILFILLTYVVASGITTPIRNMTQYMKEAKVKEWSPRMHYEGNDEIAYLSEAFNDMVERINNLIEELYEQHYRQKKHELQALQAQINPHFLYNTLEIINCMALLRNAPEIGNMVQTLASIMRYSINFKENVVTIEKELLHLKNYLYIQTERNKDKLSVVYDIDDRILPSSILKLTLQPIAENAVIHAFKGVKHENVITITGTVVDKYVCLCVTDNGTGMDEKTISLLLKEDDEENRHNENHSGIGIGNVNRRIKLTFGEEYGLKVKSEQGKGTTVEIWLPSVA